MKKGYAVHVRFPWWRNGKRVADRFGMVIGRSGAEYVIQPKDNPEDIIQLYMTEFSVIHLEPI